MSSGTLPKVDDSDPQLPNRLVFAYERAKTEEDLILRLLEEPSKRSATIVGWNGLILSVLFAGSGVLFSDQLQFGPAEIGTMTLLILSLVASTVLAVVAYVGGLTLKHDKTRELNVAIWPDRLRNLIAEDVTTENIIVYYIRAVTESVEKIKNRYNTMKDYVRISEILFLIGVIFIATFLILQIVK